MKMVMVPLAGKVWGRAPGQVTSISAWCDPVLAVSPVCHGILTVPAMAVTTDIARLLMISEPFLFMMKTTEVAVVRSTGTRVSSSVPL